MSPKEVLYKWVDAFNASDVYAITELYHDNATNHQVANDAVVGKDAIREMFKNEFAQAEIVCIVENILKMVNGQYLSGKIHLD